MAPFLDNTAGFGTFGFPEWRTQFYGTLQMKSVCGWSFDSQRPEKEAQ